MRRRTGRSLAAAVTTLLAGLALAVPAQAAVLSCGQTITQSTTLENDLGPCPGHGVVIGADNITFDLNGHTIRGSVGRDGAGVFVLNRTGVTVENGTVTAFDIGVAIDGGSANTVRGMTARDNIGALGSIGGDGIAILSSRGNQILGNATINN